jgi:copper chaperone CopZ
MHEKLPVVKSVTVPVSGMSCGSCARHIRKALDELDGVEASDVHLAAREVTVSFDPQKTGVRAIVRAIQESGYATEVPSEQE